MKLTGTPLSDTLSHRFLDVIREGEIARETGAASPYAGNTLEHCLHATGWVQRDLALALEVATGGKYTARKLGVRVDEPTANTPETETFGELPDIKATILDQAGKIVNGARRSAYGTPENNFERIARFWQAYLENRGLIISDRVTGGEVQITAADVSPMMRLMKEARLCETPDHYDSFVDIVGYTLTGAEVNRVKSA